MTDRSPELGDNPLLRLYVHATIDSFVQESQTLCVSQPSGDCFGCGIYSTYDYFSLFNGVR